MSGVIGLSQQQAVVSQPTQGIPAPSQNTVLYNPMPQQAAAPTPQQPTLYYGGFGGFYSGAYQPAANQQEWWNK